MRCPHLGHNLNTPDTIITKTNSKFGACGLWLLSGAFFLLLTGRGSAGTGVRFTVWRADASDIT